MVDYVEAAAFAAWIVCALLLQGAPTNKIFSLAWIVSSAVLLAATALLLIAEIG